MTSSFPLDGGELLKSLWQRHLFLPPATKLGQDYIFTASVILSTGRGCLLPGGGVCGGGLLRGSAWSGGGVSAPRGSALGGAWWRHPRTATIATGTHPTGMHSCSKEDCSLTLTAS